MPEALTPGFAAVRGHERARDFLRNAVENERLAHALFFAGSGGIGKHRLAAAFVAWLQCRARTTTAAGSDACGECDSCRQVSAGSHPDVQFVALAPGKKEIGVDRMRELKRFVSLRPVKGGTKVAVVDDAQALTIAAQNALLKTLEEPPPNSLLILVADNADALLTTVRSRCQRVPLIPLSTAAVIDVLVHDHGVDAAVAAEVGPLAEGSPGRALALCRVFADGRGTQRLDELAALRTARYVRLSQMAQELNNPEAEAASKLETLLAEYRDQTLHAVGAGHLARRSDPPVVPAPVALRRAEAVTRALDSLRRGNPNRQLLLEALLLRLARI